MFSNRTVGIPLKKESPLMAKVFSVYYKFFSIKVFSSDSNVTYSFIAVSYTHLTLPTIA